MKKLPPSIVAALVATLALAAMSLSPAVADPIQGRPRVIRGPSTTIDESIPRFSGTGGLSVQGSSVTIDDSGNISLPADATVDGVDISDLSAGASGDVDGPSSSTDNALPRFDGTTGKLLQGSSIIVDDSNRVGLSLSSPTHSLTIGSAGTGLAINNADGANAEFAHHRFDTNVYTISTAVSGSGTLRNLLLRGGTGGAQVLLASAGSATYSGIGASQPTYHIFTFPTATSTSVVQTILSITGTVNQSSGTGGFNGILVNPTLTAVGSAGASLIRLQAGNSDRYRVDGNGKVYVYATTTAGGTTGNQTINRPAGTVNFAAAATAITVTNSLVAATSYVFAVARTNDSTCSVKNVVPAAGSFTINMDAACTAETSVAFRVMEPQ